MVPEYDLTSPGFKTRFDGRSRDLPGDGKNFILNDHLVALLANGNLLRCPAGMGTDGPSIPELAESAVPREGEHFGPCVFHDGGYGDFLERLEDGIWQPFTLATQQQCDDLLFELMGYTNTPTFRKELIYRALRAFGHVDFAKDRASALARGPRPRLTPQTSVPCPS